MTTAVRAKFYNVALTRKRSAAAVERPGWTREGYMKTITSSVTFEQKKDQGCKADKKITCNRCGSTVKEKEIIMFAGYEICPICQVQIR